VAGELKLRPDISSLKAGQQRWSGAMGICGSVGGGREGRQAGPTKGESVIR
jgi:hypothetical protein